MAAAAVAMELEVKPDAIREALAAFSGVDRRFQVRGKERGVTVVDDYGHHPTEIRATLDAARQCGFRRIHVLFQPHRYSRTSHLMDEFARAFHQADTLFVTDIYAASERPIEGVTAEALVDRIRQFGHRAVEYVGTVDAGIDASLAVAADGDMVLTFGAGSVSQAAKKIWPGWPRNPFHNPGRSISMARERKLRPASVGASGSRTRGYSGCSSTTLAARADPRPRADGCDLQPFSRERDAPPDSGFGFTSHQGGSHVRRRFRAWYLLPSPSVSAAGACWLWIGLKTRRWPVYGPIRLIVRLRERSRWPFVFFRSACCLIDRHGVLLPAATSPIHIPGARRRA